jgi:hypothetical protein
MTEAQYDAAVAEYLRSKGVTRCPTACVVPTHASVAESDQAALRDYSAAKEAARIEKQRYFQQTVAN